jgi:hypothetical protein
MHVHSRFASAVILAATITAGAARSASASASCPPIPSAGVADPLAGVAPAAPHQVTSIARTWHAPSAGAPGYCLYQPPASAQGLVLFNRGWQFFGEDGGLDPLAQFLASQGYYVIYPDLDESSLSPLPDWPAQGRAAIAAALAELAGHGITITRLAVAGHSLGAVAAMRVAATWTGTPSISAALLAEPAGSSFLPSGAGPWDLSAAGLSSVSSSLHLLIIQAHSSVGDANSAAVTIWNALPQIPKTNAAGQFQKNFLRVLDDSSHFWYPPAWHSSLQSQHNSISALPLTAMDYWSYWNPIFAGIDEAFKGGPSLSGSAYCNVAGAACAATRFTGTWVLDGQPATAMQNAADLGF